MHIAGVLMVDRIHSPFIFISNHNERSTDAKPTGFVVSSQMSVV